jgi:hypothetical protein
MGAVMWIERSPYGSIGSLQTTQRARTKVRLPALWSSEDIQNPSYDWFQERLGLPDLPQIDPAHPRCQPGMWPWPHRHA